MIAQGLTVGVLLVSAGLAAGGPKNVDPNQPLRTEDSIYKFKKDSRSSPQSPCLPCCLDCIGLRLTGFIELLQLTNKRSTTELLRC